MSDNPYAQPPQSGMPPAAYGGKNPQQAKAKVVPPAIGLIVVGVFNVLLSLWGAANSVLFMLGIGPAVAVQQRQMEQFEKMRGEGIDLTQLMHFMQMFQGPVGVALSILQLAAGGFVLFGALRMKNLQAYGLSLGAAIVAMIPMLSNCCCLGFPIGIWAVVVLLDQGVKQNFRS